MVSEYYGGIDCQLSLNLMHIELHNASVRHITCHYTNKTIMDESIVRIFANFKSYVLPKIF